MSRILIEHYGKSVELETSYDDMDMEDFADMLLLALEVIGIHTDYAETWIKEAVERKSRQ